jgi:hypothetical protein
VHRVQAVLGANLNGGKQMALDEVMTSTQGSFISREMGGIQYSKNECVFAMQSDVDEGNGS